MFKKNIFTILFIALGSVILLFIAGPLLKMILAADFGLITDSLKDSEVQKAIWLTLRSAFWASCLALVFGIPLAYLLARHNFWGRSVVEGLIDLPIVIPHTAAGIALLSVFGQRFFWGKIFSKVGLPVVGTEVGIVLAMAFVSMPFLINAAKDAFRLIDPNLENAARTLGANQWQAFSKVSLPLAKKAIMSGFIMMWARGISEFGAVVILAYHPMTAPVLIFERFESYGLTYARPVAVLLVLVCLLLFTVLRVQTRREALRL
ncbi:ABC transporter permease [Candidatus Margulisiibacteriota bacterium]